MHNDDLARAVLAQASAEHAALIRDALKSGRVCLDGNYCCKDSGDP